MKLVDFCHLAVMAIVGIPISLSDFRHHKIYNRDLLASLILFIPLLATSVLTSHQVARFYRSLLYALIFFCAQYILVSIRGSALGMGDVKLLSLIAVTLSLSSLHQYQVWLFWIASISGITALWDAVKWRTIGGRITFAPSVFAGTLAYLATRI